MDDDELGAGNTVQVVAYKSGSVFAGGVLLLVRDSFGWAAMFNAFAGIYVVAVLLLSRISIVEMADDDKKSDSKDMGYVYGMCRLAEVPYYGPVRKSRCPRRLSHRHHDSEGGATYQSLLPQPSVRQLTER